MFKKLTLCTLSIFIIFVSLLSACNSLVLNTDFQNVGVWWWNDDLNADKYLSFANKNNVTNIYYCSSDFNQNAADFIRKANKFNIDVYYLAGEYQWLEDATNLHNKINNYLIYQSQYSDMSFKGIHLDIEPHQHDGFNENRIQLITSLITLAHNLKQTYPTILFDYDIPFWLNDEITFNNKTQPAYSHIIEIANCVHIMSYRDSAEKIYDVSKEEIEFAKSIGKPIFISVETKSTEGDNVSFMEEGKKEMYNQINRLYSIDNYAGVNIHHIENWYKLKN